ncbi:CRISPR-associated endonuclease Cas2 [Cerasicoccus frondis]|uniref:CRISPR-associated endonuclease Cas2 n=1 Tax=Cerasicoccus frondis TaxID=490090 RepID=UPI002852D79D|nr:CRISPR-associated endonuclease Cas2 [Cerasicoccus frondis]
MDSLKFKMGWLVVAFDLPVTEKEARKAYTDFRRFLLKDGFQMIQFSVYARPMVTHSRMQTHLRRVEQEIPPNGSVRAWYVTQAQWQRSLVIYGKPAEKQAPEDMPEQTLFW